MKTLFLDAPYDGKVELCQETLDYLKDKKIALYASVQFVGNLDRVREQLTENEINFVTSKADRTHVEGQLLGCDNYHNSLNLDQEIDCYCNSYEG